MPNNIIGERSTTPQNIVGILRNVGSGRGIASIDLDSGCHLVVTYTDGTTWTSDETLRGITATAVTDEYKLRITYEDGTVWTSPQSIRGPVGPSTDTKVGELEDLTTMEKGTAVGAINELDAKGKKAADSAYQLLSEKTTEDTDPYLFRKTPEGVGDRADDTIVGGTVAWNQWVRNGNFADTSAWNTFAWASAEVSNNTLHLVSNASQQPYININQSVNNVVNHIYLLTIYAKSSKATAINAAIGATSGGGIFSDVFYGGTDTWFKYVSICKVNSYTNSMLYIRPKNTTDEEVVDVYLKEANLYDLTQLFGTEIADYIYSLEQATAGAGVAWFKQYFPAEYYPYNAGELVSVKPTAKVTRGFNQLIEKWRRGDWNSTVAASRVSIVNEYRPRLIGGLTYYLNCDNSGYKLSAALIKEIDSTTKIGTVSWGQKSFVAPEDCYLAIVVSKATQTDNITPAEVERDCKISLSFYDGTYEPYVGRTYPLGAEVRGIISLSDGKLAFNNGDIYTPDGKVKRKYGIVDLGTLSYGTLTSNNIRFYYVAFNEMLKDTPNVLCAKYMNVRKGYASLNDKEWTSISTGIGGQSYLCFRDDSYTNNTAFKTAMSGVYLVYELATPTTEQSLPYDSPQVIFPEGTEQYVDDRTVPLVVGHITTYHTDMRNKLESLPDSTLKHWEVGSADQLTTKLGDTDQIPYLYRKSGGDLTVGTREYNTLVGGTVAWNQLVENGNFASNSGWPSEWSYSNNTASFTSSSDGAYNLTLSRSTPTIGGHKYLFTVDFMCTADNRVRVRYPFVGAEKRVTANTWIGYASLGTIQSNGTSVGAQSNQVANETVNYRNMQLFDLTQMLGSTIADYVYSLETATAGSGIAWLKRYGFIDGKYHPYNAGSLLSVHPSAHKMVGFNLFDKSAITDNSWISNPSNGTIATNDGYAVSDYIPLLPNTSYYMTECSSSRSTYFDADKNPIGATNLSGSATTFTAPSNAYYVRFTIIKTNLNAFCINLTKTTGTPKNGDYVPYSANSYTLPDADLRGIFKLDSNNVPYCDGDTDDGSGTRTRKYGIADLGSLTWSKSSGGDNKFWARIPTYKMSLNIKAIASKYTNDGAGISGRGYYSDIDKAFRLSYTSMPSSTSYEIYIYDTSYNDASTFKAAMNGVYLVYELATPTTEDSTPFQNPQIVDPYGTEEYIDTRDVTVPVGHSTRYPKDLKRKLEELPDPPSGANGTYILKATINNGVTTYSWVVE